MNSIHRGTGMGNGSRRSIRQAVICLGAGLLLTAQSLASGTLSYSATNIVERWQNDGGFNPVQNLLTVTLTNDNFANLPANTDFIAGGQVTAVSVPYGLTPVALRTATNKVTVALTGFAGTNGPSASTNGLRFVFNDSAFSNGPAASIMWAGGSNLTVTFLAAATNWYVNGTSGSEANNGLSAGAAFLSITNAIKHAQASVNDVIHIAAGTYTITNQPAISVNKIVTFLGDDPATTIIQGNALPGVATNGLFYYGASYASSFQNLTLRNGRAPTTGGGAICDGYYADLIVNNCIFLNNSVLTNNGGAINHSENQSWNLVLNNCTFSNNVATNAPNQLGGAVYDFSSVISVSNCFFVGNSSALNGGALCSGGASPQSIVNSLFMNNAAVSGSGGACYQGAANSIGVDRSSFVSNSAPLGGGGILAGALLTLTNTTFYGNSSTNGAGGGVNVNNVTPSFYNSTFVGNTALQGGGIRAFSVMRLYSCIAASNTASSGAGPDIYQTTGANTAPWVTNSLIGITNGATAVASPTITSAGPNTPNAYGNYIGNATTPQNPGILPLAWNGGSVPTCALQANSMAIDHGINPLNLATDARGATYPRVYGVQADMGAYEFGASLPWFVYSYPVFAGTPGGVIYTTNTIALASATGLDTFSGTNGQDFVSSGWLVCSNVPSGLTVAAARVNSTNLSVTMTGSASVLTTVYNLTFVFTSSALVAPSAVSNNFAAVFNHAVTNLDVVFAAGSGNPALVYGGLVFGESAANDGSIGNTLSITLTNTVFVGNAGDDFVALGRVLVGNVPAGLTASAIFSNPYQFPQVLTVSLSGNAVAHNSSNNTNLLFAFQDSAFRYVSAASVSNVTVSNVQIQFLNPVLAYGSKAFSESWKNDGSIPTTITATLIGDTFNGAIGEDLYASGKVTPQNLPAGLTPAVVVQSATGLVIALSGNASPNTSAQNTGSLGLTFTNAAFAANQAGLVTNYNESDLSVTFLAQNPANWYVNGTSGYDNQGTGANQGDGSDSHPWKTITNALKRVQSSANDVIHIAAGTYLQPQIAITNIVTFLGDNPATTIIEPSPLPNVVTNMSVFAYLAAAYPGIFQNLTIQNGRAPAGAGINNGLIADTIINNCIFQNNYATNGNGGAISYGQSTGASTLTLLNSTFRNNIATAKGGGAYVYSAAISVSNCVFSANVATNYGGGLTIDSGTTVATVYNSLFISNTAVTNLGGGLCCYGQVRPLLVSGCTVASNTAGLDGAGVYIGGKANGTLINSTVCGNTSTNGSGGGIWYFTNMGGTTGACFNCTIYGNTATNGGGVRSFGGWYSYSSIIASNTATASAGACPDIYQVNGNAWATNSLIGNTNGVAAATTLVGASATATNSFGNYGGSTAAPASPGLLLLAANGGPMLGSTAAAWPTLTCALPAGSLAIDRGSNPLGMTTDQRGVGYARQYGAAVDMGAFESGSHVPVRGSVILLR